MQPGTLNCSGCSLIVLAVLLALNAPVVLSDASSQPQSEAGVCLMQKQSTHMKKVKAVSDAMESGKSEEEAAAKLKAEEEATTKLKAEEATSGCTLTPNAAISGYNNKYLYSQTVASCKQACLTETSFACKSFDWYKLQSAADVGDTHTCSLSAKSAEDVGGLKNDYAGNPFDYYSCTEMAPTPAPTAASAAAPTIIWEKNTKKQCSRRFPTAYSTLAAAKGACSQMAVGKCNGVYDSACNDRGFFYICKAGAWKGSGSSCIYMAEEEAAAKLKAEQEAEAPAADKAATGAAEKLSEGRCKGDVIRKVSISTVGDCQSYCEETEGCKFFSFRESKKKCEASRKCNSFSGANKDWMSYKMP